MIVIGEFKVQAVFAALQSGMIVAGSLLIAVILKARGYPDRFSELPPVLGFVRNWGFLLIVIPAVWAAVTIWLERHRPHLFSKSWTVATGVAVWLCLAWLLLAALLRAGSSLIQAVE